MLSAQKCDDGYCYDRDRQGIVPYADKNNHMKRTPLVMVIAFVLTYSWAFGQDGKTELGIFGGGYFNSGFQSFKLLNPTTGAQIGTFKPITEANSGIFGVRSSYNFKPQMAAEATFGFS